MSKMGEFVSKHPKLAKGVIKVTDTCAATAAAVSVLGMNTVSAFADATNTGVDIGSIVTAVGASDKISTGFAPFIEPSIVILCAVAGPRLGMKFLKGAAK